MVFLCRCFVHGPFVMIIDGWMESVELGIIGKLAFSYAELISEKSAGS